ncbi:hypothetical protein M885DRAFT_611143 [Pelagophyceae sp. CCMP2097]|nr:hypothetical protein M885DRAFT_611143 [Pelagophyceae sp. CCMP2097]
MPVSDGGLALALWAGASLSFAAYLAPSIILRASTDGGALARSLHITSSVAMFILCLSIAAPRRFDARITCSADPAVSRALAGFVCSYAVVVSAFALGEVLRLRRLLLRLSQLAVLALLAQIGSRRFESLCALEDDAHGRLLFLAVYSWTALALYLCDRIETKLDLDAPETEACAADEDPLEALESSFAYRSSPGVFPPLPAGPKTKKAS